MQSSKLWTWNSNACLYDASAAWGHCTIPWWIYFVFQGMQFEKLRDIPQERENFNRISLVFLVGLLCRLLVLVFLLFTVFLFSRSSLFRQIFTQYSLWVSESLLVSASTSSSLQYYCCRSNRIESNLRKSSSLLSSIFRCRRDDDDRDNNTRVCLIVGFYFRLLSPLSS